MEQVEKPKVNKPGVNNSGVALDGDGGNKQDDDDGVVSVLLIHNGHRMDHIHNGHRMGHIIDMPAYNFIERGLLEAVRQHQQKGSTLHTANPYPFEFAWANEWRFSSRDAPNSTPCRP